jgi:hypothetical protein
MNMLSKIILAGAVVAASATAASACNVDTRQALQQARIWQGVTSGRITFGEYLRLERNERRINQLQAFARWTGGMNPAECAALRSALNYQSFKIFVKKHN